MNIFIAVLSLAVIAVLLWLFVRNSDSRTELEKENQALAQQLDLYHQQAAQQIEAQQIALAHLTAQVEAARNAARSAQIRIDDLARRYDEVLTKIKQNDADIDAMLTADLPERLHVAAERYRQRHPK